LNRFFLQQRRNSQHAWRWTPCQNWEATNNETIVAAGTQLGKAELLFAKIEDNQVEAQRAKLEATLVQKEEEVGREHARTTEGRYQL